MAGLALATPLAFFSIRTLCSTASIRSLRQAVRRRRRIVHLKGKNFLIASTFFSKEYEAQKG